MINIGLTIKIFIIVLVAYIVLSAWGEVIERFMIKYFNLNKEEISTWLKIALISTVLLFFIVYFSGFEVHDLFGISETVDIQLTGMKERFKNGKVQHYNAK